MMDVDHRLFAKDYVKPKPEKPLALQKGVVPNPSGFFTGLPLTTKKKKGANIGFGVNKGDREAAKLE